MTTYDPALIVIGDQTVPEQTWPSTKRCSCGSNHVAGTVVRVFSFCLLCRGTGWRVPIGGRRG